MLMVRKFAYGVVVFAAMSAASAFAAGTLPAGYTEIKYIQSSGTQYINTGVVPITTTRVVVDFSLTSAAGGQWNGWGSTGSKESFFFGADAGGTFMASVSGNWTKSNAGVAIDTARHTFDLSSAALKFDGQTFVNESASPFSNAASGNTLYLFAMHWGWSPGIGGYVSMRLYSCQIYDGETLVRDFVPVVKDSDGKAGLYDTVTDSFFGNSGTDDFVAGDEVVNPFLVLPIPDQTYDLGYICRPEFTVSNVIDAQTWTIGGDIVSADFDVEYANNVGAGVATVTATGKGALLGNVVSATFNIVAGQLEDENIVTVESSVRRFDVGDKYVYVFPSAAAAAKMTMKRSLILVNALLVAGGGAGGNTMGGGGGGGGVVALDEINAAYKEGDTLTFTVGAGGAVASGQNRGGNGGNTVLPVNGVS